MPTTNGWSSPQGLRDLKEILSRLLPQWPQGPYDWQVERTALVLDGVNQFVVIECGGGKTALSYLPILVLQELARNPTLPRYGVDVPPNPTVLMVGPLSDLSVIQVSPSNNLGGMSSTHYLTGSGDNRGGYQRHNVGNRDIAGSPGDTLGGPVQGSR